MLIMFDVKLDGFTYQINWEDPRPGHKENKMVYYFDYLPAGLFNRAQVRLCLYIVLLPKCRSCHSFDWQHFVC